MIEYRLRAVLEEKGRTLYWLAKELELNQSSLTKAASGKSTGLKFDLLDKICDALEVTPCDLLVFVPNSKKKPIK
jgi:putative transcriptional regulator